MKVWTVEYNEWEPYILGIFSSREAAERYRERRTPPEPDHWFDYNEWEVQD